MKKASVGQATSGHPCSGGWVIEFRSIEDATGAKASGDDYLAGKQQGRRVRLACAGQAACILPCAGSSGTRPRQERRDQANQWQRQTPWKIRLKQMTGASRPAESFSARRVD